MRNLGLKLLKAPQKITDKLRSTRPNLAGYKVLSLITKQDVRILEAYQNSRTEREQELHGHYYLTSNSDSVIDNNSEDGWERIDMPPKTSSPSTNFLVENLLNLSPQSSPHLDETVAGFSETQERIETRSVSSASECEPSDYSDSDGNSESSGEEICEQNDDIIELFRKRDVDVDSIPSLIKRFTEMKDFFQSDLNFKRRQSKMSDATWRKYAERIVIFLAYCARNLHLGLSLELVGDMRVVESFIQHIKRSRRVKNNTAALYVSSLIMASKFLHANESRRNYDEVESITDLRALQNQLNREHAVLESAKGSDSKRLFWPQFQELTRSLHQKYEDESDSRGKARLHMNFTLLLLFAINPGRAREFRTLRMSVGVEDHEVDELVRKLPNGENLIIFAKNGVTRLVEKGYKTVKRYGPNVIEISEFEFVDYNLKRYAEWSRPKLMQKANNHDSFFVNSHGMPFRSASSFSRYVARIFQQHLGFHCTINEMRHALVEHFRASKDSADVGLAESLARVCKHSLRTQVQVYDRRSQQERTKRAHHYLNQSAVNSILDDIPGPSSNAECPGSDSSEEERMLPSPGEMCALLPSDVRSSSPEIFLAKVLHYNADGRTVRLAWFREIDGSPNHYKFQIGNSVWEESVSSLIYPLDISYNREDGVYELRSSKEEIFQQLR